jgi:hypothetical protein
MKKSQSNKLNAYDCVQGVLEENWELYENEAVMKQAVAEFFHILDEIGKAKKYSKEGTMGLTVAKDLAKEKLARLVGALSASASVYAFESSDAEMEASFKQTYTDIRFASNNTALDNARALEAELLPHREKLTAYMVSAQDLENLHQHILAYDNALEEKGGAKSGRVAESKEFARLIKETDRLLVRKLDRLVLRLQALHPDFFTAYYQARMVVDL